MFMGVNAYTDAPRVDCYDDADRAFRKYRDREAGKRRRRPLPAGEYPLGGHHKSVTWVRRDEATGAIAFRLYDTDVVTWHNDNSVEIENFGTATTTAFASRFTPRGIHLNRPVSIRGNDGGNRAICYHAPGGEGRLDRRMCRGDLVRFTLEGDHQVPDEATLDTMRFVEVDRKAARAATADLPWKDFDNWLSMAPMHLNLEHNGFDLDDCVDALRRRDFRAAAVTLPAITIPNGWGAADRVKPLAIRTAHDEAITLGSIGKLKLAIWEDAGALDVIERTTVSCREYDRLMSRVRDLRRLGISGYWDMGAG